MKYYIDTSTLLSLYILEKHSERALNFITRTTINRNLYISRLTEVEFYSALAMKLRTKAIDHLSAQESSDAFNLHIKTERLQKLLIADEIFTLAKNYLEKNDTSLRTLDALHLACSSLHEAILITSDKVLYACAKALNIPSEFI